MKREFLQNFKVGEQALPKEVIDAILDENSRDIGTEKSKYADYDALKTQLAEAGETIEGFKTLDVDGIKKAAEDWKEKFEQSERDHAAQLAERDFNALLDGAVTSAKGKSAKAIRALLDVDALKASKNQEADVKAALEGLKKESGYLFDTDQAPPPYAPGTGTQSMGGSPTKETFAKMGYNERLTLKKEHPEIYEQVKE